MWFSSLLVFTIFVEGIGSTRNAKSLILFKAGDFESAQKKALEIGINKQSSYLNGDGKTVEWRLNNLETLDEIGDVIIDGREVYSEFNEIESEDVIPFDSKLYPESSEPTQTGV